LSIWKNKVLRDVEKLIIHGHPKKANEKLITVEQKNNLSKETIWELKILKADMLRFSNWTESLEIIEQLEKEIDKPILRNEAFLVKALCFRMIEKNFDALKILEEAEELLKKSLSTKDKNYKIGLTRLLLTKGDCYNLLGEIDLAQKVLKQSVAYAKSLENNNLLLLGYHHLGLNSFFKADYEKSLKYFNQCLKIGKEIKNDNYIRKSVIALAQAYQRMGKFEEAIKHINQSIDIGKKYGWSIIGDRYVLALNYYSIGEIKKTHEIFREIIPVWEVVPNPRVKSLVLWMKSSIEWYSGSLEKTIEYLTEAVDILKSNNDKYLSTLLAIYLASALNDRGEYDKALEMSIENFKIFKEYNNDWFNSYYYDLLGKIYHVKGNYNLALENAKTSLDLREKLNSVRGKVHSLFQLISISIDKSDVVLYNQFLDDLKNLNQLHPNPLHDLIYKISQALVLKTSSRPRDWMKALEILESISDEDPQDKKYAIVALNNLCELLMIEFSISGDENILIELEDHIERLTKIAKFQNNYALKLETTNIQILTLWLKAQYSLAELDIKNTKELLQETKTLAGEEGLFRLVEKMSQQQERLLGQVSKWDDFIRKYYEFIKE
jgi:tetratricopeptide (TPR) repeat protein